MAANRGIFALPPIISLYGGLKNENADCEVICKILDRTSFSHWWLNSKTRLGVFMLVPVSPGKSDLEVGIWLSNLI